MWSLRRHSQSVGSAEVGEEGATVARPASAAPGPLGEFARSTAPPQDSVSRKRPKAPGDNARPTGTPDALHVSGWPVPDPCVARPTAAVPQLGHCSDAPFRDWRHVRPPQLIPLGGQRLSCIPCCRCRAWPPRPSGSGRPDIVLPVNEKYDPGNHDTVCAGRFIRPRKSRRGREGGGRPGGRGRVPPLQATRQPPPGSWNQIFIASSVGCEGATQRRVRDGGWRVGYRTGELSARFGWSGGSTCHEFPSH